MGGDKLQNYTIVPLHNCTIAQIEQIPQIDLFLSSLFLHSLAAPNRRHPSLWADTNDQQSTMNNEQPDELRKLCKEYHDTIAKLESDKYDLEYQVRRIDYDIHELSMKVSDMRGKL